MITGRTGVESDEGEEVDSEEDDEEADVSEEEATDEEVVLSDEEEATESERQGIQWVVANESRKKEIIVTVNKVSKA